MAEKPLYSDKDKALVAQRLTTQRINTPENPLHTLPTAVGVPLNSPLRKVWKP